MRDYRYNTSHDHQHNRVVPFLMREATPFWSVSSRALIKLDQVGIPLVSITSSSMFNHANTISSGKVSILCKCGYFSPSAVPRRISCTLFRSSRILATLKWSAVDRLWEVAFLEEADIVSGGATPNHEFMKYKKNVTNFTHL